MATVVSWRLPRFAPLLFAVAALIAYSRVYVGVHYPLDVFAGAVLGMVVGKVLTRLGRSLDQRWRSRSMVRAGTVERDE
jgi:membrane-associated phospholipid phosphatase